MKISILAKWVGVGRIGLLLGTALVVSATTSPQAQAPSSAKPAMTVYKSATCGCCEKWVAHMKANGFNVTALDVDDIEVPMKTYGVPSSLASCLISSIFGVLASVSSKVSFIIAFIYNH